MTFTVDVLLSYSGLQNLHFTMFVYFFPSFNFLGEGSHEETVTAGGVHVDEKVSIVYD